MTSRSRPSNGVKEVRVLGKGKGRNLVLLYSPEAISMYEVQQSRQTPWAPSKVMPGMGPYMVKPRGNYVPQAYVHSKLASLSVRQSQLMKQFQAEEGQLENQLRALKERINNTKEKGERKRLLYQYTQDMNQLKTLKARKVGIMAELKKEEVRWSSRL